MVEYNAIRERLGVVDGERMKDLIGRRTHNAYRRVKAGISREKLPLVSGAEVGV